jgi:hypothetical protein
MLLLYPESLSLGLSSDSLTIWLKFTVFFLKRRKNNGLERHADHLEYEVHIVSREWGH